jgi:hypothetical protein
MWAIVTHGAAPRCYDLAVKLAAALVLIGTFCTACAEPDRECDELYAELEGPTVTLAPTQAEIGHFTLLTRGAPAHYLDLRVHLLLSMPESGERTRVLVTLAPDPGNPFAPDTREPAVRPGLVTEIWAGADTPERECLPECEDGFSLQLEWLDAENTTDIVAEWSATAHIIVCPGQVSPDPELELRLD